MAVCVCAPVHPTTWNLIFEEFVRNIWQTNLFHTQFTTEHNSSSWLFFFSFYMKFAMETASNAKLFMFLDYNLQANLQSLLAFDVGFTSNYKSSSIWRWQLPEWNLRRVDLISFERRKKKRKKNFHHFSFDTPDAKRIYEYIIFRGNASWNINVICFCKAADVCRRHQRIQMGWWFSFYPNDNISCNWAISYQKGKSIFCFFCFVHFFLKIPSAIYNRVSKCKWIFAICKSSSNRPINQVAYIQMIDVTERKWNAVIKRLVWMDIKSCKSSSDNRRC